MINWILANTAFFIALVCGLALWVSLTVEYIKDLVPEFDPKLLVLITAFVATLIMYLCGGAYLGLAFLWFEAIPSILCCVFVAYIAQNGYDKLVKRYKDIVGEDDGPDLDIEDEFEDDEDEEQFNDWGEY